MANRDYADIARKLRAKAADKATTAEEREALIVKAEALEKRVPERPTWDRPKPIKLTAEEFIDAYIARHFPDLDDIVETGYRYNREDDW